MATETNAFIEYGTKAREEHVTYTESFVPGFVTFNCDVDVYLGIWDKTLAAGNYFLRAEDMTAEKSNDALVYLVSFDADQLRDEAERAGFEEIVQDDGTIVRKVQNEVSLNITMEPVEVERGHYLTFLEYVAWLAMTVAETDEIRQAIFDTAYTVEVREETPKQDGKRPRDRHDPVTKLAQNLTNPLIYGEFGSFALNVAWPADKKKKRQVETAVSLEYIGDDKDIKLARPISEFDVLVLNGYIAQITAGRTMFTASDVFEAVTGSRNPTKKQLTEYTESLDRMRFNRLNIDMTQEAKAHDLVDPETGEPWKSWKVETMLVPADKITMTSSNGRTVEGYVSTKEPVVYTHARMTNQIVTYPIRYLDTKKAGSNTPQNTIIKNYLMKRIRQAQENPRMSRTILYSTIYAEANVNASNKTVRKRTNDYIEELMKIWIDMGLISGYAIEKENRKISKLTISFDK